MIQLKKRKIVKTEVKIDKSSWIYQSQYITDEDTDTDSDSDEQTLYEIQQS